MEVQNEKETLVQIIIILILTAILGGLVYITITEMNNNIELKMFGMNPTEEEVEKKTKKD